MGHANLSNISEFLIRHLYAKGSITIVGAQETFSRRFPKDGVLHRWLCESDPVVVPVCALTESQRGALDRWLVYEHDDDGNDLQIIQGIVWRYGPGWRAKYPDLPQVGYFEN